jgi:hypothetical protein
MDVVFENGTRGDIREGVYLHHVVMGTSAKADARWISQCPGKAPSMPSFPGLSAGNGNGAGALGMSSFVGGAVDEFVDYFTTPDGQLDSGYYIPKNTTFFMFGEIINYMKEGQKVYLQADLEYVPGKVGSETVKTALNSDGKLFPSIPSSIDVLKAVALGNRGSKPVLSKAS